MTRTATACALAVTLAAGLLAAAEPKDLSWVQTSETAAYAKRDSAGEFAYRGKMWIVGGWYQSFEDPPRDVWNSADGKEWTRVAESIAFKHTDLTTSVVFKDKMWLMGGWHGGRLKHASATNGVWSSSDGVTWTEVGKAGWEPRMAAAGVVFKGKMWVLGGNRQYYFGTDKDLLNDVWSTEDGVTWQQATAKAPWSGRAYHQAVAVGDKMYVIGGGNYLPRYQVVNDVWSTTDGATWTQETAKAPWPGRIWFSAVTYRDRMWVLGGWTNNPSKNHNDVWYSADGKTWTELKTKETFPVRHEHSAFVHQDSIWVTAGMKPPLLNDTWKLHIPEGWFGKR